MSYPKISLTARFLVASVLLVVFLSSCATVPKPIVPVKPGKEVETLQSMVSLSFKNPRGSIGGHGYLIFKRPDKLHLAVLSPFGFTVMEVFVDGDRITCLVPSKDTAYAGLLSEMSDHNALKGLGMMRRVVDDSTSLPSPDGGRVERTGADGEKEILFYDKRGLLERKENGEGDQVRYDDYRQINGVAFPSAIEMFNRLGDRVKVSFDEPEVNTPVDDAALVPSLDGMKVLPISDFKGF
jgi:outer membrane lipoprotein-sorting protein